MKKQPFLFSRIVALFLSLNLAIPSPAFGLREIQTGDSDLEEQQLTATLHSSATVSTAGLEEGVLAVRDYYIWLSCWRSIEGFPWQTCRPGLP